MDIASGLILYAILWFLTLFVVLPLDLRTQADHGEIVPGTPESAPHGVNMRRKLFVTTIAAIVAWFVVEAVVGSGLITIRMFDINNTLPPVDSAK
jgi:predicted secreted protein